MFGIFCISYNGLGERWYSCPSKEWRSPNAVDMYKSIKIIQEACEDFGVPFIDTRSITGAMEERAEDYNYYKDISGGMEALYFLRKLNVFRNCTMSAIPIQVNT